MGGRITIDSATLMNKGFEMIEAHHLFGVPYERIDVVVHPQSIVHSLVNLNDGASLAHLGYPDMKVPISYALNYPSAPTSTCRRSTWPSVGELDLRAPGRRDLRLPAPGPRGRRGGRDRPCVLNAADEVAVEAFLDGRIPFTGIAEVIERTLEAIPGGPVRHFEELFEIDEAAREHARGLIEGLAVA